MRFFKSHLLLLLLLIGSSLWAQKSSSSYLGIEGGIIDYFSDSKEKDYIRKEYSPAYYNDYTSSDYGSANYYAYYAGIKYEKLIKEDRIGLMTGLRFTKSYSDRRANNSWTNSNDFFYVLYNSEGTTTEYLKVKKISQETYYLGVPLEARYLLFGPRFFRLYFKLGAQFNFSVSSSNHFEFVNNSMQVYEKELSERVEKPGTFNSSIYGGVGMRLGRESNPALSLELTFPAFTIGNSSTLVTPNVGVGVQANIQIPYNK